jgi:hypothetical protein
VKTLYLVGSLIFVAAAKSEESLPAFKGEYFSFPAPIGYKFVRTSSGIHDASQGSVMVFAAQNSKEHLMMAYYDSSKIVRSDTIPALADLISKHLPSPTGKLVATGMIEQSGRNWALVEFEDDKASKRSSEHVIILMTSVDNSLFRLFVGGPQRDADELGTEARDFLDKLEAGHSLTKLNHSTDPTLPSGTLPAGQESRHP